MRAEFTKFQEEKMKAEVKNPLVNSAAIDELPGDEKPSYIERQRDYSIKITLRSQMLVYLRDMTGEDLEFIGQLRDEGISDISSTMRLVSRLCTKWGDKSGVTEIEIKKIPAVDVMRLAEAVAMFLT